MARFNLNGFLDNSRFEDFFARFTGGSSGHDHLNGTTGGNALFAGAGDDDVTGMAGNDTLNGGSGADNMQRASAHWYRLPAATASTARRLSSSRACK